MDIIDQINKHEYVYLTEISEPDTNVLRIVLEEAQPRSQIEELTIGEVDLSGHPIVINDNCAAYEVVFEKYIVYSVRNESYTQWDNSEAFIGHIIRVYSKSKFLDFVRASTTDLSDGRFKHFGICSSNHVVDIASAAEPQIKILRSGLTGR